MSYYLSDFLAAYKDSMGAHYQNHHPPNQAKTMNVALKILTDIIRESEGCKLDAYLCPAGRATIGYGCAAKTIKIGMTWTQQQADDNLTEMANETLTTALAASPCLLNASPERQAALSDFIYNLGIGNYRKSNLKKAVDRQDWHQAQIEINKWVNGGGKKLPGLVIRRKREAELLKIA